MKKVLITGSSGYVGSHLLKKIVNSFDVFGLDKSPTKVPVKFYYGDITNEKYLKYKEPFDCVIHLAALLKVGESVQDPISYYQTNIVGTLNVLKNIKTNNFILASTGATEGLCSPYAVSKKAVEEIVVQYCSENKIDYTIFRFGNIVGSEGIQDSNEASLIYNLIKSKETGMFTIFGNDYNTEDGTCVRDYVHVNEICDAIILAIDKPANNIEILGHGVGISVLQMFEAFKKVNDLDIRLEYAPRRDGDMSSNILKNTSSYLEKKYSIEDYVKI